MKRILIMVLYLLNLSILTACSLISHKVTFETYSGDDIKAMNIVLSQTFEPPYVNKVGSVFVGWYLDPEFTIPFEPGSTIESDITLHAKWTKTIERFVQDIRHARSYQIVIENNNYTMLVQATPRTIYETSTNKYHDKTEIYIRKGLIGAPVMSYIEPYDTCWTESVITSDAMNALKDKYVGILDYWLPQTLNVSWFDQDGDQYTHQKDKYFWAGLPDFTFYTITVTEKTFEIYTFRSTTSYMKVTYNHIDNLSIEKPEMNVCGMTP